MSYDIPNGVVSNVYDQYVAKEPYNINLVNKVHRITVQQVCLQGPNLSELCKMLKAPRLYVSLVTLIGSYLGFNSFIAAHVTVLCLVI